MEILEGELCEFKVTLATKMEVWKEGRRLEA